MFCEGELRAIARYGSTAGISDVTFDGQITIIQLRYIESHSTLWLYSIHKRYAVDGCALVGITEVLR